MTFRSRRLLPLLYLLLPTVVLAELFEALEYRNIGPTRGGRVTAVAGTVAAPGTFYLGASGGGVWKTEDHGTSWRPMSDAAFDTPSVGDIAVAQHDANIVYVGTGSDGLRSNVIRGKGVYKSIDGGETWTRQGLTETGHIGAVEIDPRNPNTVWVAAIGQAHSANAERGVYRTRDGGANWDKVLFVSDEVGFADVELVPGNPDVVYAAAWRARRTPWTIVSGGPAETGGIYKSVDGGDHWEKLSSGLPEGLIGKIDLAVTPADSSIVYALIEAPGDEGGLYKSVNQGRDFVQISAESSIRTRPFYYANIDVDPTDPDVLYAMATRNMKSVDGGRSWSRLRPPHGDSHDMWINPDDPQHFVQANDGGANVTFNGGETWSTQFNQPTAELYQVEVDDQYPYWLYAGQQDNGTTIAVPSMPPFRVQDEQAWLVDAGGCETGPAVPKPGNANIVYANCKGRFSVFDKRLGTERSHYIGAVNIYGHNPADLRYRFQRVAPIHVSPHDPDVVYMGSQYVHRTRDDGRTWETISPDLTAFDPEVQVISGSPITRDITGEEYYSTLYSLRESPLEAGLIWVGANDGPVHVSRDDGATWTDVTPSRLPAGGRVDAIEPSPHDPAKAYIAVLRYQLGDWRPHIYRTTDYGRRWTRITDGIPEDEPVRVVREDPVREGLLFAGTDASVYVSFDDGASWRSFRQNLPITPITDLKIVRGDLALSTMGRGFWVLDNIATLRQAPLPDLGDEAVLFEPADTVRYRQIHRDVDPAHGVPDYPAPAVEIDYYLPEAVDDLRLEIVAADGRVVNAYRSGDPASESELPEVDMATGAVSFLPRASLKAGAGLHRFRWNMRHQGPWHESASRRFEGGPYAVPGGYRVRLSFDGRTLEQALTLVSDPRMAQGGVTLADVQAQSVLRLRIVDLLSEARRLAEDLEEARDTALEEAGDASAIEALLTELVAADQIYPQPQLREQISYLYNMLGYADQAPGGEAIAQFEVLDAAFADLKARADGLVEAGE